MNLRNLFRKPAPAKQQVQIVQRDICRMSVEEWRSTPALVSEARRVIESPVFQQMLDLARSNHPAFGVLADHAPDFVRQHWQSKGEGYTLALAVLQSLGEPQKPAEILEPRFEPEELQVPETFNP